MYGLGIGADFSITRWMRLGLSAVAHPTGGLWECTLRTAREPPSLWLLHGLRATATAAIE